MDQKASLNSGVNTQISGGSPFATYVRLNERSVSPAEYRTAPTFSVTRLKSSVGLQDRITKSSSVPAILLSVSLKPLASSSYRIWAGDKLIKTATVRSFRTNVVDFDAQPRCWAGSAFDFVHYSIPRSGLNDIAEDLGHGLVRDYRPAVLEDDLVVAQITKSVLPYISDKETPSVLALDQLGLILGSHLLQRYGIVLKAARPLKGGLSPWQERQATELLRENLGGRVRLAEIAKECRLSTSHFARSFKTSFGVSPHQWLIQHRIDYAKQLMSQTGMSLPEISILSGFNDQAAFTNAFRQSVGTTPGRWRRSLAPSRQA